MQPHDFERLEKRVNELEQEVASLKRNLQGQMRPIIKTDHPFPDTKRIPSEMEMKTEKIKHPPDLETLIGQIWLPRIFIVVLLLGCIFGFKVASDNHLLSPALRVLFGYAGAILLFLLGYWQVRKDRSKLGMILFGGTVALLMLTTFACHVLYHFIPSPAAFLINLISIAIGLGLSYYYKSEYLAVFVGIGGYLLPFLLENSNPNVLVFAGYESLLYLVLFLYAVIRSYRILYFSSIFLLNITFLAASAFSLSFDSLEAQTRYFALGVFIQHIALLLHCLYRKQVVISVPIVLYSSFVMMSGWWSAAFSKSSFTLLMIAAILLYGGLAWKGRHRGLFASIATYGCLFLLLRVVSFDYMGILILIEGTIAFGIGYYYQQRFQKCAGLIVYGIGALTGLSQEITIFFSIETVYWCVLVLTLFILYYFIRHFFLASLFIVTLFALITQWSLALSRYETDTTQQMILSIVWAAFALLSVLQGKIFNYRSVRILGMALLFLVLIKIVLIDLPIVSLWIRAVLFIIIGVAGLIASRFFYTFNKGEAKKGNTV